MHFHFTPPKSLKITPSDEKIEKGEKEKKDTRVEGKRTDILLVFLLSTLEIVTGEEKTLDFFSTVFINPEIYKFLVPLIQTSSGRQK